MSNHSEKTSLELLKDRLRKGDPFFDEIEAALDQFGTGGAVTERCSANGQQIVVERSYRLGRLRVRAGDLLLHEMNFTPRPDSEGPLWVSSEDFPSCSSMS